jgi:extracellular matrix regulatory protein A
MSVDLIPVGFTNYVAATRVVAIANPSSSPIKRMIRQAEDKGMIIDLTSGRRVKSVLVLDSGHVALVARQADTIAGRVSVASAKLPAEPQGEEHD